MTTILAVDPGPKESAYVLLDDDGMPRMPRKLPNEAVLSVIPGIQFDILAIEMVASFGMAVGAEVFETVFWSGRFVEAWGGEWHKVYRKDVKLHLCGSMRAKDGNIRCALIDKFGGKEEAIGTKKAPGPLRGISGDIWSALAVGITFAETKLAEAR